MNMREGAGLTFPPVNRPTSGTLKTSLQLRPRWAARA
jgi:hypothetical protein